MAPFLITVTSANSTQVPCYLATTKTIVDPNEQAIKPRKKSKRYFVDTEFDH